MSENVDLVSANDVFAKVVTTDEKIKFCNCLIYNETFTKEKLTIANILEVDESEKNMNWWLDIINQKVQAPSNNSESKMYSIRINKSENRQNLKKSLTLYFSKKKNLHI